MSKNKAVPTEPITAMGSSIHNPVMNALPENIGNNPLINDKESPIGIKVLGENRKSDKVSFVVCANECKTNAIEAINPPTNPPPER